jgi:hypothetical protein
LRTYILNFCNVSLAENYVPLTLQIEDIAENYVPLTLQIEDMSNV